MFSIALQHDRHTREYAVTPSGGSGWELTLQEDHRTTRQVHYTDWHRLERAVAVVGLEVDALTARGWRVAAASTKI